VSATFDLLSRENQKNPFSVYQQLRAEHPVHLEPRLRAWVLTRFDDVDHVLNHPTLFSVDRFRNVGEEFLRRRGDMQDVAVMMRDWAVYRDPPDHTRMRSLLAKSFAAQRIETLRPLIQRLVDSLLDRAEERTRFDFITDFAFPLPAQVICSMLGVPQDDLPQIKEWSTQIAAYIGGSHRGDDIEIAKQGLLHTFDYFRALVRQRRGHAAADLLDLLRVAEDQGDVLSEDEVVANCVLLLFAGHETTANLLGSGLYRLLSNPPQHALLRAHPELTPSAVEEFLRYDPPVAGTLRVVTQDTEIRGQAVGRGESVAAMLAAANRDPLHFEAPEELRIQRSPNRHLTFGYGIHFCLGAPLARLEAQIAFTSLLRRFRRIELIDPQPRWKTQLFFRGLTRLELAVAG
jgi:cytochrome P450